MGWRWTSCRIGRWGEGFLSKKNQIFSEIEWRFDLAQRVWRGSGWRAVNGEWRMANEASRYLISFREKISIQIKACPAECQSEKTPINW
jgi:hypothetical protein